MKWCLGNNNNEYISYARGSNIIQIFDISTEKLFKEKNY
jgi:hypothetical protein